MMWRMTRSSWLALPLLALLGCGGPMADAVRPPDQPAAAPCAAPAPERCEAPRAFDAFSLPLMGTVIEVRVPAAQAVEAAQAVFAVFADVDARMSEWQEGSPLAQVNARAGAGAVSVPDDLLELIRLGLELGQLSGGAFDISWAALWGLWDFRAEPPALPDPEEVDRRAALVDFRRVEVDAAASTVRLPAPGMKLGLGGVAKGWALDRAAERLRALGVRDFLLSAGGQVLAGGDKGSGPWVVGIRDPRGPASDAFAALPLGPGLRDVSVSTSGDYERGFELDGVRYHHILDPRTGYPARGLRSVTVVAPDATRADALSTAVFVMGVADGLALVEHLDGVEAVLVDGAGALHVSSGLRAALQVHHLPHEPRSLSP